MRANIHSHKNDLRKHTIHNCIPFCVGLPANAIRCFLRGREDYHPKPWALLSSCEKRDVRQIPLVNNPQQISAKVSLITLVGSLRGNRQRGQNVGHKSHGNPLLWKSLSLNHLLELLVVVPPTEIQHSHTHQHKGFNLHASVLCKHRSDHIHWAVSLALIRLFVLQFPPCSYPCFVHCHSSRIMGRFHHAGTSTEVVGEMQRSHVVSRRSSHTVLSSHALMNAAVWTHP